MPESEVVSSVHPTGSLAKKYGITKRYDRKFAENPNFRYDDAGAERETNNPSPKTALNNDDADQSLTDNFQDADSPPLWADRTTGREVSPADFIKLHYGKMNSDGSWNNLGLSRSQLQYLDLPLYNAYAQQVRRNPKAAIPELPSEEHKKSGDPATILEERRARDRQRKALKRAM